MKITIQALLENGWKRDSYGTLLTKYVREDFSLWSVDDGLVYLEILAGYTSSYALPAVKTLEDLSLLERLLSEETDES